MSPKFKPCMLRSEVMVFEASKTLILRSGDRSFGFDTMTMAKRPRGENRVRFA